MIFRSIDNAHYLIVHVETDHAHGRRYVESYELPNAQYIRVPLSMFPDHIAPKVGSCFLLSGNPLRVVDSAYYSFDAICVRDSWKSWPLRAHTLAHRLEYGLMKHVFNWLERHNFLRRDLAVIPEWKDIPKGLRL